MNCEDIRAELSAFMDGETQPGEAALIEQHLSNCGGCQSHADALTTALKAFDDVPALTPSDGFEAGFRQKLAAAQADAERAQRVPWWRTWRLPVALLGAAAAAVTIVILIGPLSKKPTTGGSNDMPTVARVDDAADTEIAANLEMLQDYEVVTQLDKLEGVDAQDLDVVMDLDQMDGVEL